MKIIKILLVFGVLYCANGFAKNDIYEVKKHHKHHKHHVHHRKFNNSVSNHIKFGHPNVEFQRPFFSFENNVELQKLHRRNK